MPTSQLRSLIQSNEKGRVYKSLYGNLLDRISIKDSVIAVKDSIITEYKVKDAFYISKDAIRDSQIANYQQQLKVSDKSLRKQKRKTFVVAALGTLLSGMITFFAIQ